jgi:succinate dehydrogenase / fumarate reductase membrane anchor subunit
MVKSVLSVGHQGLRDWIIQRISAIVMAVYSVAFILYLLCHPGLSFAEWHSLFSHQWMKIFSAIFLLSILWHAWIGMWTIFTDYVKPCALRNLLNVFVLILLATCFFWGILILWSV